VTALRGCGILHSSWRSEDIKLASIAQILL
jgi:hypothetical protein